MEQIFIKTIDDLRQTVKVNASLSFVVLKPYLDDAFEKYLLPYLGETLVERLAEENVTVLDAKARVLITRALGPLAIALASPELGVLIGDSGHTVTRNEKFTVASDSKIIRSEESMQERGWDNLERLLELLSANEVRYPEWKESLYYKRRSTGNYLNTAREFQELGKVNIGYSRLTFERFRPLLEALYMKLARWIGTELDKSLREEILRPSDPVRQELIEYIRVWLAMNVAKLHTSQTTRVQRTAAGQLEFRPVIYPLYADPADNGNFYAEQVTAIEAVITDYMTDYAVELGLPVPVKLDFNSIDKHIFLA
ncbi:DUF6712 family protein [Parabacteroides sp. AM08-6]|uniref:DUF6712 family protein n=1 Tax=Parabacteroides sp. AM08-6 TaxID=2292053 RepID=UPI000F0062E2|nr:DUF6712 family protein [Parabacteroides sp. AM08-6]RHJ83542.1 hypothetical protein DW103_07405 [Parabacteroides sp. AM08-6]